MAIWQYEFHVIPKDSVVTLNPNLNFKVDSEGFFDEEPYWNHAQLKRQSFSEIANFLTPSASWSNQMDLYGNVENTCVQVFFNQEAEIVESMSFRIDVTANYKELLNNFIPFALANRLIVLNENLNMVPLQIEDFEKTIQAGIDRYNGFLRFINE